MNEIHLIAPPQYAARLAEALRARGIGDKNGARAVVVSSLAMTDVAAAAVTLQTLGDNAIVAAQTPPQFPFIDTLTARAAKIWGRPPLAIPPLHLPADFARAAQTIAAVLTSDTNSDNAEKFPQISPAAVETNSDGAEKFPKISPAAVVAKARRILEDIF